MNLKSTTALVLAAAVLAGCGGGSDSGGTGGGGGGGGANDTFSNGVSNVYDPAVRGATNTEYDELENGIVYYVGNVDGTVSELLVRVNAARDTLFVQIDGGPEVEYAVDPTQNSDDGSTAQSAVFIAANGDQVNVTVDGGRLFSTLFTRENSPLVLGQENRGFGGLETDVANLTGTATYSGNFTADAVDGTADVIDTATSDLAVDFAAGTLSGTHAGTSALGAGGAISGGITGEVIGSRAAGTLDVSGAATGDLNFGGVFTGDEGESLRGGVAGTLNDGTTDHTVGGDFVLSKD